MYSPTQAYTPGQNLDTTRALLIGMKQKGTLQSYVAQHKNSPEYPYLLALASSINQISDAAKAADHAPAPQTVADQKLNALAPAPAPQLPEDVGIGQLPAQNIANMAGGGIVAFGDGGEVPRYQSQGLVQLPGGLGILGQGAFGPQAGAVENQPWAQRKMDEIAAKVEAGTASTQEKMWLSMFGGAAKERASARQQQALYQNAPNQMGGEMARLQAANNAAAPTTTVPPDGSQQKPDVSQQNQPPGAQPSPGLPSVNAYLKQLEMAMPKKETAESEESFMRKREEPMKAYFDKANAAIEKERSRLEEGKQQDFYMSLIEGGLAAAGGTSQYGLQNIAQGMAKGASSFKDALKDFRKAAQENSKMEMDLMKAKAADKKNDIDAYQKHMDSVAERNSKRDGYYASGVASLLGHDISSRATIAAAGMPSGTERLISKIGTDPKFAAAYEKYASMGPNAKLPNQILAKYADAKELAKLQVMDPDMYALVKPQIEAMIGGGGIPRPMAQPIGNARP